MSSRNANGGKRATDVSEIEKQVIRVNINQLNTLMNLVGELVIKRNHLERQLHFVQAVKEQLSFSQACLLKTVRGFEEKYEFSLLAPAPPPAARPKSGSVHGRFLRHGVRPLRRFQPPLAPARRDHERP